METGESITVKVPDSEIDKIISRGIKRALRFIGYFVYSLIDKFSYVFFYMSTVILLLYSMGNIVGADPAPREDIWIFLKYVTYSAIWLSLKGIGLTENLAKWLKIDDI